MLDWKRVVLEAIDTVDKAIQVLDSSGLRIIMVANNNGNLLGTVTDGDIRRSFIQNNDRECLADIMCKNPITASTKDGRDKIIAIMQDNNILHVPVLDNDNKIVGLETIYSVNKLDNPVFLIAGGFGVRLKPITNKIPKPLVEVGGKPILETILCQFIDAGFYNFYISVHYKFEMIKEYFGNGERWNVNIQYIYEDRPLGTAGSIGLLPDNLPDLPILVMNGDLLTKVNLGCLLDFHKQNDGIATMCVRKYDFQVPYGVIQSEDQKVVGIVEKPMHSFFVNAGIYVLESDLVKNISGKSHIDMTNLLEDQIHKGMSINMFPIYEYWLDIGQKDQLEQARIDYKSFQ